MPLKPPTVIKKDRVRVVGATPVASPSTPTGGAAAPHQATSAPQGAPPAPGPEAAPGAGAAPEAGAEAAARIVRTAADHAVLEVRCPCGNVIHVECRWPAGPAEGDAQAADAHPSEPPKEVSR